MNKNKKNPKGFTLIELLIVIAILVILAVVVILTLNPAQLLAQARDSQRISDLATLKSAISLFLADVGGSTSTSNCALGTTSICFASSPSATAVGCNLASTTAGGSSGGGRIYGTDMATSPYIVTTTVAAAGGISGAGWIPVNFSIISSGAPIGREPIDPTNSSVYFYTYSDNSSCQFKLTAHMESARYENGGSNDVESTDGGVATSAYETGTALTL